MKKLPSLKNLTRMALAVAVVATAAAIDHYAGTNLLPWALAGLGW